MVDAEAKSRTIGLQASAPRRRRSARLAVLGLVSPVLVATATAAAPGPTDVVREVPAVVVRAPALALLPDDPSSFRSVIHREDHAGEGKRVEDVLSEVPGVHLRRLGGPGDPVEVTIRGSTSRQVAVEVDGIRVGTAQSGSVDLATFPLALLERVEVARGGGSAQAGSGALGGVVNLVSRRPGGPERRWLEVSKGSFSTTHASIAGSGSRAGLGYVAAYDVFHSVGDWDFERPDRRVGGVRFPQVPDEAERINNRAETHAGMLALRHELGAGVLTLRDSAHYSSRGMPGLDAGSLDAGQSREGHERRFRNLAVADYEIADVGGSGFGSNLAVSHLWERVRFRDPSPAFGASIASDDRNDRLAARLRLDREGELSWLGYRTDSEIEVGRDRLVSDTFDDRTRDTFGAFLQLGLGTFDERLRLIPAVRYDHTEGFGGEWIPRLGVVLGPWAGLRFKANLERSYRVPAFDELYLPDKGFIRGNPGLRPETSTDLDLGFEFGVERLGPLQRLRLESAWFRREIDDSVVFVVLNASRIEPVNTGAATVEGLELAGSVELGPWLDLRVAHTHLDATVDRTGTPLVGRPEDETHLRLRARLPRGGLQLVVEMHDVSEIPVSASGGTILPARTTWDASLGVDLALLPGLPARLPLRELRLSLLGRNLSDELVRDAQYFPQPGRSFAVLLEAGW